MMGIISLTIHRPLHSLKCETHTKHHHHHLGVAYMFYSLRIYFRLNQEKGFCEIDERLWKSYAYIHTTGRHNHICLSHCTQCIRELRARLCRVNFEILRKTIKLRSLYMKHFISVPHRTMCVLEEELSVLIWYCTAYTHREIVAKQRTMGFWLAWEKWSLGIQYTV